MEDKSNKNKPIKVPEHILKTPATFMDIVQSITRPLVEHSKESYNRYQQAKESYRNFIEESLKKLTSFKEKLYFLGEEHSRLEKWIIYYRNKNYTYDKNHTEFLRDNILLPYLEIVKREDNLSTLIPRQIADSVNEKIYNKKNTPLTNGVKWGIDHLLYQKIIDYLIAEKKFNTMDRSQLMNAYYGLPNSKKIIFCGNGNSLLTALYDLKSTGKIISNNKIITQWVLDYFVYQPSGELVQEFSFNNVYETLNKSQSRRRVHKRSTKYIDILQVITG